MTSVNDLKAWISTYLFIYDACVKMEMNVVEEECQSLIADGTINNPSHMFEGGRHIIAKGQKLE